MGYPVAYRNNVVNVRSSGFQRLDVKVPVPVNDNNPWRTPPIPANDNVKWTPPPVPANDNIPVPRERPPIGEGVIRQVRVRNIVRLFDPIDTALWSAANTVLNLIPGYAKPIPPSDWGLLNNWRGILPLFIRWSNRSEVFMANETSSTASTRFTGQAYSPPPNHMQNIGAGTYLSLYDPYWVQALSTWRMDETATYGPAPANIATRQYTLPLSLPDTRPLPYSLVPLRDNDPLVYVGGNKAPEQEPLVVPAPHFEPSRDPEFYPAADPVPLARPEPRPAEEVVPDKWPYPDPPPYPPIPETPLFPFPDPNNPPELWRPPGVLPGDRPTDLPNPPMPPLPPRRPPPPRTKERKTRAQKGLMTLIKHLGDITEWVDVEKAFHDNLPKEFQAPGKNPNPFEMGQQLYLHWDKVDLDSAIFDAAYSQISDYVWAGLGLPGGTGRPGRPSYGGNIGFNRGNAHEVGPQLSHDLQVIHDHVVDVLNQLTGLTLNKSGHK
jgi:hypothetical protein